MDEWKKNKAASQRRKEPQDILPPLVDFEAVFIPDSARALGQIAPTLAYNEVRDVTLIGPNLWNTPATVERAGKLLKDPIFLDSVLTWDPEFQSSTFYKDYLATFGEAPDDFDVIAYDTGLIVRRALDSGAATRPELQAALLRIGRMVGAFGEVTMTSQREVARPVTILTVSDGRIQKAPTARRQN
jgi:ABC-type branched-subunit amino acid transport system substrate-binding protein